MLGKISKWLLVFAASTITLSLYAASDAPGSEEIALRERFAARSQTNNSCNTDDCAPPPCAPKPCAPPPCKPCCVPAKLCPMPMCEPPCYDPCCGPMTYTNHNINPSSRCSADNSGAMVMGDFLWWRSDEPDTSFAFVQTDPTNLEIGYIANINYKWKPGFRVGLGWDTYYDGWDLLADWTWYRNKSNSSVTFPFGILESASVRYRLLYNMFDLDVGKGYYISCGFTMRPYVGAKGGWINRKQSQLFLAIPSLQGDSAAYYAKMNYWGVGPHAGLNTQWKVGMGFEFFGNVSGALLYGNNGKNFETSTVTLGGVTSTVSHITNKKHSWRTVPTAQIMLGLGWGECFNCNKLYFAVGVAWEANFYWNLPSFVNPVSTNNAFAFSKNVDLNGLTVDVRLDF